MALSGSGIPSRVTSTSAAAAADAALIAGVRAGDLAAFEMLVRTWAPPLIRFAGALLRSEHAAEEVVQDLFIWIWDHRFEWDVPGPLAGYLFRAIRNRAINRLRHQRVEERFHERLARETPPQSPSSSVAADQHVLAKELSSAIESAIAGMSDRCREVLVLNRQQGLSYAQIAETLQISVKTVEIHMARALVVLRRALAAWQ